MRKNWNKQNSRVGLIGSLIFILMCLFSPLIGASGGTTAVNAVLTIGTTCTFTTSNTAVNFGTLTQGTNTIGTRSSSYNIITVTNTGFNPSNILISGSNWYFGSNTFTVTNTIWSTSNELISASAGANTAWNPQNTASISGTNVINSNVEIQLTISAGGIDTLQQTTSTVTNTLWFGANAPTGSTGGTYSQTVNIVSSC